MKKAAGLDRLPFFPLPGLVFFPPTLLPLHMFEPRYRELAAWCIQNESPLAVVRIRPGHEGEQPGDPPVAPVAGVGHLILHEKLPDGRYHLVLRGFARVRLMEEIPCEGNFRMARTELLPDIHPDDRVGLERKTRALRKTVENLIPRWPQAAKLLERILRNHSRPAPLADYLASFLFEDPEDRQQLLECVRVEERLDRVLNRLTRVMTETTQPSDTVQ